MDGGFEPVVLVRSLVIKVQRYIRRGKKIEIVTKNSNNNQSKTTEIESTSNRESKRLALALAGIRTDHRLSSFQKLQSHPWYGTVILEELSENDRTFIVLFIQKHENLSKPDFSIKVHRLFIDDKYRPSNHAIIQEVLACL